MTLVSLFVIVTLLTSLLCFDVNVGALQPGTLLYYYPNASNPAANDYELGGVWGVAVDNAGNIYARTTVVLSNVANDAVVVLSTTGVLLHAIFNASNSANTYQFGSSIAVDSAANIYVDGYSTNGNNTVVVMSSAGTLLHAYPNALNTVHNNYAFGFITGIAVDGVGNIYVSDEFASDNGGLGRVVVLSPTGTLLHVYPNASDSDANNYHFDDVFGVAVDSAGNIYVVDSNPLLDSGRVVVLSSTGVLLGAYPNASDSATSNYRFLEIYGVAVDSAGNIYVADAWFVNGVSGRVVVLSSTGVLLQAFPNASNHATNYQLEWPQAVAVDKSGNIYVGGSAYYYSDDSSRLTVLSGLPPITYHSGSLCILLYSLPGNIDYPWSVAYTLHFLYNSTVVRTSAGSAVTLMSGAGSRTYTNRFGASFITMLTLASAPRLYLNSAVPIDSDGLVFDLESPVQLPGNNTQQLVSVLNVFTMPGGVIVEGNSALVDGIGQAVLSNVPGVVNSTIGASNANSLAVQYGRCQAPITFTNGLRPPTQPSVLNGGTRLSYSYFISDGVTYSVQTNLTLTAASAFANSHDQLGNPYQVITNITGSRQYTYLPIPFTITSIVTGTTSAMGQRFYPYSLLSSTPGVYSMDKAPFLDANGLAFAVSPPVPPNGQLGGTLYSSVSVFLQSNNAASTAVLTESPTSSNPVFDLQRQSYGL